MNLSFTISESIKQDLLTLLLNTVFIVIPWGIFCYIVVKSISPFGDYPMTLPIYATESQVEQYVCDNFQVTPEMVKVKRSRGSYIWQVVVYYNRFDCEYSTLELTDRVVLHYFENKINEL
jgi:hypothetical protein